MRMWMLPPTVLCNQHLLGEHNELHKLAGCLRLGRSLKGYLEKGLVLLEAIERRHGDLAVEMIYRGMNHKSPLSLPTPVSGGWIDMKRNAEELSSRCETCRLRMVGYSYADPTSAWSSFLPSEVKG